ncbi:MAG: pyridoxal 5'-phosphate synthase glutaminase subunit PdxT [Actinomycetaceae bacterium]|nr:pyridoxal 5'-phosphate synthase glutaminase subunit PdxT [Actinomycetaceae bacterium]
MTTAVLALQGAFAEHRRVLEVLGEQTVELRQAEDLRRDFDRLVLPGGESTVQGKLLRELGMLGPLRERVEAGMPVLGTCAGLILMAARIEGDHRGAGAPTLGTLPVTVRRNAYGRQLASFHTTAAFAGLGDVPMTFIRAPQIVEVGDGVEVLAEVDDVVVAARYGSQVATAFHPELDGDTRIHELFLGLG